VQQTLPTESVRGAARPITSEHIEGVSAGLPTKRVHQGGHVLGGDRVEVLVFAVRADEFDDRAEVLTDDPRMGQCPTSRALSMW